VDCVSIRGGKLQALERVRTLFSVPRGRCVAAGDSGNDILMLEGRTLASCTLLRGLLAGFFILVIKSGAVASLAEGRHRTIRRAAVSMELRQAAVQKIALSGGHFLGTLTDLQGADVPG
jgi:hypothetical protein